MKKEWKDLLECPDDTERLIERWEDFLDENLSFSNKASSLHTQPHEKRVLMFSLVLAQRIGLNDEDKTALAEAAVFHDTRRMNDNFDVGHGQRAADYYREYCKSNPLEFDKRTYLTMAFHDRDDRYGEEAMRREFKDENEQKRALDIFHIFKDSDGLDRLRIAQDALDPKFLRTAESQKLIEPAKIIIAGSLGGSLNRHWRDVLKLPDE